LDCPVFSLIDYGDFGFFGWVAFADYSIAVKPGDWVNWKSTVRGQSRLANVTGARMDIIDISDPFILISLNTRYANGTVNYREINLDPLAGSDADNLVIPRNLNVGDQFYDKYQGNITITSIQQLSYGGALRSFMSGHKGNTTYCWDRETGVLVNATSTFAKSSINTQLISTNIWQPDILGLKPAVFYLAIVAVIVAVGVVVAAVLFVKRFKP